MRAKICAALISVAVLSGCADMGSQEVLLKPGLSQLPDEEISLARAEAENLNRMVQERYADDVIVAADDFGMDAVEAFFPNSLSLIISDGTDSAQLRAASLAVVQRAPMVIYDDSQRSRITGLIEKLGVERVLLVGDVPFAASVGGDSVMVLKDPGTTQALGDLTAFQFESQVVANPHNMVRAVAELDAHQPTELKAAWEPLYREEEEVERALPAQSRRDSDMAPVIIATPNTPVASVATARAYGGDVRVMNSGDPRDTKAQFAMVAGLDEGGLVALGDEFGDEILLSDRIREGWSDSNKT